MKTKHFLYTMMLAVVPMFSHVETASAQGEDVAVYEEVSVSDVVNAKPKYYAEKFGDNMYLSIGAGAQTLLAEHLGKAKYTLAMNLGLGKWITPNIGVRLNAVAGSLHSTWIFPPANMNRIHYVGIYGDFTMNLMNMIGGYDESRVFSIIPFVGIGFDYTFKNNNTNDRKTYTFPLSGGIKLNFRLNHYIDFYLEGRANVLGDQFNGIVKGAQVESVISAVGGFTFKFGKNRFKAYNPYADQAVVANLNNRVNNLRQELDACNSRQCPPCPEVQPTTIIREKATSCNQELTSVVRFRINSSTISTEEMVNVYNIAEWMKKNPNCNVTVAGYADKDTGTSQYNMTLSQKRANNVRDALVNQYGINANRIQVVANGSDKQPYPDNNNWNRVVIFFGEGK